MRTPSPEQLMAGRVRRLTLVSAVALGLIWWLAREAGTASSIQGWVLAAGWALMPAVLGLSLRLPPARLGLVIPATLVTAAIAMLTVEAWRTGAEGSLGWGALLGGLLLGDLLGAWLWFGLFPVPRRLQSPDSPARWLLIAVHVALVVSGPSYLLAVRYG